MSPREALLKFNKQHKACGDCTRGIILDIPEDATWDVVWETMPAHRLMWGLSRPGCMPVSDARRFMIHIAREAVAAAEGAGGAVRQRVTEVIDVAELYLAGNATEADMQSAVCGAVDHLNLFLHPTPSAWYASAAARCCGDTDFRIAETEVMATASHYASMAVTGGTMVCVKDVIAKQVKWIRENTKPNLPT